MDTEAGADRAFSRLLGREVRRARETRGWTRVQLVARLPSQIGDRTLLSYEHGVRQMTVVRYVEICQALDIPAWEVLRRALVRARDLSSFTLRVDLRAVIRDTQDGFEPVRAWARNRLVDNGREQVLLAPATAREMAVLLGYTHAELAAYLADFAIEDIPEVSVAAE